VIIPGRWRLRPLFVQPERIEADHVIDPEIILRIVALHVVVPGVVDPLPDHRQQRRIALHERFGLADVAKSFRCIHLAVDYAKDRTQFGKPIGSYQAVKHHRENPEPKAALYLPALIAMLVLSLALGATAFVQLRRNREVAQLRQRFIANVSHELRTPLTQMSMFAEMLETSRVRSADEARQFASVIHRETKRLSTLVEGVLHFSRGQEGAIRLQRERRDMESEIADALVFFRPMAAAANVSVTMEATPGITVNVDPGALRQVLLNLLDNAVKYGPRGQHITIALTRTSDSAMVAIRDEGRGIPLVDRDRVFDPYVRLHSATDASVAGAGIGMSVVRELVRAHDGRVWVAPTAGEGATIVFTIPLAATDAPITDRPVSDHPVEIR